MNIRENDSLLPEWNMQDMSHDFSVFNTYAITRAELGWMKGPRRKPEGLIGAWVTGGCKSLGEFLLFPINYVNHHWSLAIAWLANEGQRNWKPSILYLDSSSASVTTEDVEAKCKAIRSFLNSLSSDTVSSEEYTAQNLPLAVAKVPQQKNGYDCGLFVLHMIILFIMCPEKRLLALELIEGKKDKWFDKIVPCSLRQTLHQAITRQIDLEVPIKKPIKKKILAEAGREKKKRRLETQSQELVDLTLTLNGSSEEEDEEEEIEVDVFELDKKNGNKKEIGLEVTTYL